VLLADHVLVQNGLDLGRLGDMRSGREMGVLALFLGKDLVAQGDAFVADIDIGSGDQLPDLLLRFPQKEQRRPGRK